MDKNANARRSKDKFVTYVAQIHQCSLRTVQRALSREKGYNPDILRTYLRLKNDYAVTLEKVQKDSN